MIEQEFNARYPNCNIDIPTEYTMNNITAFAVFCRRLHFYCRAKISKPLR